MLFGRRNAEMGFELDVSGVKIELEISGYKPVQDSTWYSEWCRYNREKSPLEIDLKI